MLQVGATGIEEEEEDISIMILERESTTSRAENGCFC
jgi:hypothetical protein